jgi:hypothetical protein
MAETREIPRTEWFAFFETFSKQHRGEMATVLVIGEEIGAQEAAKDLPFVGISADDRGSDSPGVRVQVGTETEDHVEHAVPSASRVYLMTNGADGGDALEIEQEDGPKTMLQLKPIPALQ